MAHLHGVTQWLGLPVPHLPLHFLLASYTSGPDVCVKLHDKGTRLLQDTHTNKVRGNKQDLTLVLVCPCGLQLVLVGSSLLLLSSTLHPSSLPDPLPHELQTPESDTKTRALLKL